MPELTGAIRITTGIRTDGATTMATGIAMTTAITIGIATGTVIEIGIMTGITIEIGTNQS